MSKTSHRPDVKFWRDPDLPGVEIRYSRYTTVCFPKHTHDCYSVAIVEEGTNTAFLRDSTVAMTAGDLIVIHPGEVHACNPLQDSGWTYRMFYIDAEILEAAALDVFESGLETPEFPEPVFRDDELSQALVGLNEAIEQGADALEKESRLLDACAMLLSRHAQAILPEARPQGDSEATGLIRKRLEADPTATVKLEELAALTGLSRYAALRTFQREEGLSPHAYQTQLRIAQAKRLMRDGASIVDAALATGYSDQSHFSNAFKQVTGATPRQYRLSRP
ncbi:AraC family transcriptional regulator [Desulfovibrio ferrophilus]|uniref:Helix-turn-helix-domain containing protein AraC type n=1 Tax=Desulfovibrio ferrophilus TaxID=241368 RepID=A0A2Z6AUK3_9BACT|nr:AraC family transcriptional regulator [Desulfovibrio ferrophilus]BBD06917.1 helix-turn-helix-domain containing protein AraC type [Desulfovibrio ferrophilus]